MSESIRKTLKYLGESPPPSSVREPMGRRGQGRGTIYGMKSSGTSRAKAGATAPDQVQVVRAPSLGSRTVRVLAEKLDISPDRVLLISDIAARTFHRRQEQDAPLTPAESDRVLRIARVAREAERVFGRGDKATRWLKAENRVLGAVPLALLGTDAGAREVEAELGRIEHGIFA